MLWLVPLILIAPRGVLETRPGRVQIDWTAGRITAIGVGAPDLRAPGPGVARVTAERVARREATRRLLEVAETLPLAQGGKPAGAKLDAARRLVHDVDVRYSSDGAVEATLALPLEAVRQALGDGGAVPAAAEGAPTAILVDLGRLDVAPALGITLQAGATRLSGPTVWHRDPRAAGEDPRLGPRAVSTKATAAQEGVVMVDLDEARLAAAAKAGALVVIVNRKWDGKR